MSCVCTLMGENNSTRGFQLCCSVLDSMGGAESYRVSVSCVGSPASVHGLDNVPAPQSQKNLKTTDNQGFKHKPQRHSGTRTTRFAWNGDAFLSIFNKLLNIKTVKKEKTKSSPIVPYKLYIMSLVAFFDTVNTDGIPICCITGVTSGETKGKISD